MRSNHDNTTRINEQCFIIIKETSSSGGSTCTGVMNQFMRYVCGHVQHIQWGLCALVLQSPQEKVPWSVTLSENSLVPAVDVMAYQISHTNTQFIIIIRINETYVHLEPSRTFWSKSKTQVIKGTHPTGNKRKTGNVRQGRKTAPLTPTSTNLKRCEMIQ
ncbi:unnamed protein product [Danaus chrysippus]|uniref:(African queen) hypothetical protein n=1 Tax=Danaus chrysippus TaxID=151541 RepID=A0A8J2QVJ1_9NEOP|nr:unnamed protein product [Danaus chrysippus]